MKINAISHLKSVLDERMKLAWDAMEAAQQSGNQESKSTVGDKYETARSMAQQERDLHARQYEQLRQERLILERIDASIHPTQVGLGALVQTTGGTFLISVSVGKIVLDGQTILAISTNSPIGSALMSKKIGENFVFQGKQQSILSIN